MTLKHFQDLARHLGATLVFNTGAEAIFSGPKFTVIIEATNLADTTPLEATAVLATIALEVDHVN